MLALSDPDGCASECFKFFVLDSVQLDGGIVVLVLDWLEDECLPIIVILRWSLCRDYS
jgi:hypothetical protein